MLASKRDKRRVVIVGGGFAGRTARRLLQRDFEVVLLDGKGYFEYTPSILRCLVEPSHAKKVILAQPDGTRVATAVSIDGQSTQPPPQTLVAHGSPSSGALVDWGGLGI